MTTDTVGKAELAGLPELAYSLATTYQPVQYITPALYESEQDDSVTFLACGPTSQTAVYDDEYDAPYRTVVTTGPGSGSDIGRCGTGLLEFGYTQDCLDHDACVAEFGSGTGNCGDEFNNARDDFVLAAYNSGVSGIECDPNATSIRRSSPGATGPGSARTGSNLDRLKRI